MRHAKSSWDQPELADFYRPLNRRGLGAAETIGKLIAKREWEIGAILSSPARRAEQTAGIVRDIALPACEIRFIDRIYESSPQTLIQIMASAEDALASGLLIGHNPGMEGLVRLLTARSEVMPTAALAVIDLAVRKWSEITPGCGTLLEVIRPKELTL